MTKYHLLVEPRFGLALLLSLLTHSVVAAQEKPDASEAFQNKSLSLIDAFTKGKVNATFRYRFESVDQSGFIKDGYSSTLRTTLGYRTGEFRGFQGYVEFEDITELGADNLSSNAGFGSYANGATNRPVIADPAGTNVQQAYIDYSHGESRARLGPQEIALDDQRFVGPVGWRQHHQSFDALLLTTQELEDTTLSFAYIDKVNQITRRVLDTDTIIVNGNYDLGEVGKLTAYDYYLDMAQPTFYGLSTNTVGLELKGLQDLDGDWGYHYELEYAYQSDVANNPTSISTHYYHVVLGGVYRDDYGLRVGYEVLGGSPSDGAFQTPLATLHAWNGWADKFLVTPINGLRDIYVKAEGPLGSAKWSVIYHNFSSDSGGMTYGNELDAVIGFEAPWGETFNVKLAYYDADRFATDTTKVWIYSGFRF